MSEKELYEDIYGEKFSFGKNWELFLKNLTPKKIAEAKKSLSDFTKLDNFEGKVFVDIGCGSGLFSLCALKLGAKKVISVDIDDSSIKCAKYLRKKYNSNNSKNWEVIKGSALDKNFIETLPKADILYSWGVLHHTGDMYRALDNVDVLLKNSIYYLAIYNDFKGLPFNSSTWVSLKKFYSSSNYVFRKVFDMIYICIIIFGLLINFRNPISYIYNYSKITVRGMNFYRDVVDWLGGYPFEYASVKKIDSFYKKRGLKLINLNKTEREGCNEFLFLKT